MSAAVPASTLLSISKAREEYLPTGLAQLDQLLGGLPRGTVTELTGGRSSGKMSLLVSVLAQATERLEFCAVVDVHAAFDLSAAARSGVELSKLVWVRCRGNPSTAMKAADLILHGGGFGVVCLDLSDVPPKVLQRIPISWWWRFRRAIENTPTVLLVLAGQANVKSCSSCWLDFRPGRAAWSGGKPALLLAGLNAEVVVRKPVKAENHVCLSLHAR
jgi:hypothetical protein